MKKPTVKKLYEIDKKIHDNPNDFWTYEDSKDYYRKLKAGDFSVESIKNLDERFFGEKFEIESDKKYSEAILKYIHEKEFTKSFLDHLKDET